jgi:hypothetical protein
MTNQLTLADHLGSANLPVKEVQPCYDPYHESQQTGLRVEFENGMTLSIQWHSGAYSNVGRGSWVPGVEPTFEAAAWYPEAFDEPWVVNGESWGTKRKWFNPDPRFSGDDVLPYVTVAQVMEFARAVAVVDVALPCVSNFGKALALVASL